MAQQDDARAVVDAATTAGEQFASIFYPMQDNQRQNLINLYQNDSVLLWNGNVYSGLEAIQRVLQELPPSLHRVLSVDCQPVATSTATFSISVSVCGEVSFDQTFRTFSQSFILMKEGGNQSNFYIKSDCFRFL